MKFYYLTDTSNHSLSPFFSKRILAVNIYATIIISGVLAAFWPWRQPLATYIWQGRGPFVFFPVFAAALVIFTLVQFRCGRGEMIGAEYSASYLNKLPTFEIQYGFFQYGLIECLLHVIVTLLPTLPLLMLATSISGLHLETFGKGLAVIALAALLCRMFGFLMYVLWGRASIAGYLVGRIFLAVFLFVTALHLPTLNPLRVLYALAKDTSGLTPFVNYAIVTLVMTAALIFANSLLVRRRIAHQTL